MTFMLVATEDALRVPCVSSRKGVSGDTVTIIASEVSPDVSDGPKICVSLDSL